MNTLTEALGPAVFMVLAIVTLAATVEAVLEFFVVPAVKALAPDAPQERRVLIYKGAGAVFGLLLSYAFGLDLLGIVLGQLGIEPPVPTMAYFLGLFFVGVLMARGANWWHDFGQKVINLDGESSELPDFDYYEQTPTTQ